MFGFRLKAKSEHEAKYVSGWYGVVSIQVVLMFGMKAGELFRSIRYHFGVLSLRVMFAGWWISGYGSRGFLRGSWNQYG